MSTNLQKRLTKQVRVGNEFHKRLKLQAIEEGITLSKLLDRICEEFLEKKNEEDGQ